MQDTLTPTLRVLIADDSKDAADSLATLVQQWGHEPHVAYDGQQALDVAAVSSPHVAVLDIGMPRLDGWEVARRLRERPGWGLTLLLALTGYGREEDALRSRKMGFDHHLTKPHEPDELRSLLACEKEILIRLGRLE